MSNTQALIVETQYGKVQGIKEDNGIYAWRGIPYAQPPVGSLSFKAPQPLQNWNKIYMATSFREVSPQKTDALTEGESEVISEDCLYLNIWSPKKDGRKLPVMFWIHGGGYINGSGSGPGYRGANMAKEGEVVIVTINYRLGPWGFLYLKDLDKSFDSNVGIRDQIAALKWVKGNIEAFGGDSENITIFGESAGGASIINLLGSPIAKGLFHKAIAESPSGDCIYKTPDMASDVAKRFLQLLEIPESKADSIKNLPLSILLDAVDKIVIETAENFPGNLAFQPVIGDDILPIHPLRAIKEGSGSRVPLIAGFNENEGSIYEVLSGMPQVMPVTESKIRMYLQQNYPDKSDQIYDAYRDIDISRKHVEMGQVISIIGPATRIAETMSAYISKVYMYHFKWATDHLKSIGLGCFHSLEIPFVFNNFDYAFVKEAIQGVDEKEIQNLSHHIQQAWISFAHTGSPNYKESHFWESYNTTSRLIITFDNEIFTRKHPKEKYVKVFEE